jgi:hypothetical protein
MDFFLSCLIFCSNFGNCHFHSLAAEWSEHVKFVLFIMTSSSSYFISIFHYFIFDLSHFISFYFTLFDLWNYFQLFVFTSCETLFLRNTRERYVKRRNILWCGRDCVVKSGGTIIYISFESTQIKQTCRSTCKTSYCDCWFLHFSLLCSCLLPARKMHRFSRCFIWISTWRRALAHVPRFSVLLFRFIWPFLDEFWETRLRHLLGKVNTCWILL